MKQQKLLAFWYSRSFLAYSLWPLSQGFQIAARLRFLWYQSRGQVRFPVPIVIVGNLLLGGTGKTPFVAWLAKQLIAYGYAPGLVSRGYGRKKTKRVERVTHSDPKRFGDEPCWLASETACPVVVGNNRVEAVRTLLQEVPHTNLIICDDGLQHYALARDIEIVMVDASRQFGNGFCLPAGPLREAPSRLSRGDFVLYSKQSTLETPYPTEKTWVLSQTLSAWAYSVLEGKSKQKPLQEWVGKRVHAMAGIGDPKCFFDSLRAKGIDVVSHPFPDHHFFKREECVFQEALPILMTEKDAEKCRFFATEDMWAVPLEVSLPSSFMDIFLKTLWRKTVDKKLLEILACPICKQSLLYQKEKKELICKSDRLAFPIREGIPIMLENEARPLESEEW